MQDLTYEDRLIQNYDHVLKSLQEKYPGIEGVKVDVSPSLEGANITLTIGDRPLFMTPEQAVDLIQQLRRAVVKVKPKALRNK